MNGTQIAGDWIQIFLPERIFVTGHATYSAELFCGRIPVFWSLVGSNDGVSWNLIHQVNGESRWNSSLNMNNWVMQDQFMYNVTLPVTSYSIYRWIYSRLGWCSTCDTGVVHLGEQFLLGYAGKRSLPLIWN